jgi:choline dehydrogenase
MPTATFDYVIVGAGSAGCVLANRLSAEPTCTVALLEAGGRDRNLNVRIPAAFTKLFTTGYDWNYTTSPQPHLSQRRLYWPRGRTLGGCSSINAQMWVRGHPADFDAWAQTCPGWSYRDLLPYFQRAEHRVGSNSGDTYGTRGPLWISELRDPNPTTRAFLAACGEIGVRRLDELNQADPLGFAQTPVTQRRGRRVSAADGYLRPAAGRRNLTILTGTQAEAVLLDGTRATGVAYRDTGNRTGHILATREVIVSAGTVNSPQLLMLSGIGDPTHLRAIGITPRHALPGVGDNLQDHLSSAVTVHSRLPVTLATAESPRQLARYLLLRKGMLTSNLGEAVAFTRSNDALPAPDLELIWAPVPFLDHGRTPPPGHGLTIAVVLLQPDSRGRIRLATRHPTDPPVIDPGYLSAATDLPRIRIGLRTAQQLLGTTALQPYVGAPMHPWPGDMNDSALDQFVRQHAETLYHPTGTCRMGTDPGAVVDPELTVRGLRNLRVVDASVIPTITRGHIHAPTVMIAERAADLILAARRTGPEAASLARTSSRPSPSTDRHSS